MIYSNGRGAAGKFGIAIEQIDMKLCRLGDPELLIESFSYAAAANISSASIDSQWIETDQLSISLQEHNADSRANGLNYYIRCLYVFDVEDVNELNLEEIKDAWRYRSEACGSIEAAAEIYAMLMVYYEVDLFYQGYDKYLTHPEVAEIFIADEVTVDSQTHDLAKEGALSSQAIDAIGTAWYGSTAICRGPSNGQTHANTDAANLDLSQETEGESNIDLSEDDQFDTLDVSVEPLEVATYGRSDVFKMSIDDLQRAWDQRKVVFSTLTAAAEALAILRHASGADLARKSGTQYLNHPLIGELEDFLPLDAALTTDIDSQPSKSLVTLMVEDKREFSLRNAASRIGQAGFRQGLLIQYDGRCCITECQQTELVEAAHIIPYKGEHSNHTGNGLLLRVDLHRLFDLFLLSIDPETLSVVVAGSIVDESYKALAGKRVFNRSTLPDRQFLEYHYKLFLERNQAA